MLKENNDEEDCSGSNGLSEGQTNEDDNNKPLVVAYGNARLPSNAKDSVSTPTKYVGDKCVQYYDTVEVDEFRTSSMCPECCQLLCKVRKKVEVQKGKFKGQIRKEN